MKSKKPDLQRDIQEKGEDFFRDIFRTVQRDLDVLSRIDRLDRHLGIVKLVLSVIIFGLIVYRVLEPIPDAENVQYLIAYLAVYMFILAGSLQISEWITGIIGHIFIFYITRRYGK